MKKQTHNRPYNDFTKPKLKTKKLKLGNHYLVYVISEKDW